MLEPIAYNDELVPPYGRRRAGRSDATGARAASRGVRVVQLSRESVERYALDAVTSRCCTLDAARRRLP